MSSWKFFSVASNVSSKAEWILRSVSRIRLCELGERALEIGTLGLEALDVLERLLVLALGERVDRAELLAAAADAVELDLDLGALVLVEGLGRRTDLAPERRGDLRQLAGRLGAAVAEVRDADLGLGHRSPAARSFACSSASSREQARSCSVTLSSPLSPSIRRSSAAARSPAASRASAAAPDSLLERGDQIGFALDPRRQRVLLTIAEHVLDAAGDLRCAVGGSRTRARPAIRSASPASRERRTGLERRGKGLPDPLHPGGDGVVACLRARRLCELLGERAERGATTVEAAISRRAATARASARTRSARARRERRSVGPRPRCACSRARRARTRSPLRRSATTASFESSSARASRAWRACFSAAASSSSWPCSSAARSVAAARPLALEPGVDVGRLSLALERAEVLRASRSTSSARRGCPGCARA